MRFQFDYRGFSVFKTGRSYCDYFVKLEDRPRWGEKSEIMQDIDSHLAGIPPKYEPNK